MHVLLMTLFCGGVGAVLGAILRDEPREMAAMAAWITAGMLGVGLLVAWLLYFLPG